LRTFATPSDKVDAKAEELMQKDRLVHELQTELDAINKYCKQLENDRGRPVCPWSISFSYGRALQKSVPQARRRLME